MSSGYALLVAENEAVVGFHGMFTADAGSHELLRLNIVVDDTPLGLQLLSSRVLTEYEQISIGGSSFLLPRSSELTMVDLTGRETRNRTRFSNCRQYAGQSSVSFSDMPAVETGPARRRSGAI